MDEGIKLTELANRSQSSSKSSLPVSDVRDIEHRVGALRFEGDVFSFNGRSTSFVEIYATSRIPRSGVPKVKVAFQPPSVNVKASTPDSVSVYHPRKGDRGSPSPIIGRAQVTNGGVQVEQTTGASSSSR